MHVSAQERNGWLRNTAIPSLPAESPAFWFRLGMILVAMTVVFMAWYLHVTRQIDLAPGVPGRIATMPAPETPMAAALPPSAAPAEAAPATVPVAARPPPAPAPEMQAKAVEPAPAPAPAPVAAAAAPAQTIAPAPEPRPAPRVRRYAREEQQPGEPSYEVVRRALALARGEKDLGPPIAPGPGPQYEWTRTSPPSANDPGPPIAPGPGPLYDATRPTVRTPSWFANDPGPPVAIGPGPLVDYSAGGSR
ncbi:MAG: hypothetical protein WKG52_02535 [Variovorax sp.]